MGRGGKEAFLRVVSEKMVYLSAAAAVRLGSRAELYERGGVTALAGDPAGTYHLGAKSEKCGGRNLCSAELVRYLWEKHGVAPGGKLTAWSPEGEAGAVIFLAAGVTREEARWPFDGRFRRVELVYHRRYGSWVFVEDNCVSFTGDLRRALPERLALRGAGRTLALAWAADGPYRLEERSGRKGRAVYSGQLAEYLRTRFGGDGRSVLLFAKAVEGGVCFSDAEEALAGLGKAEDLPGLDLGDPGDRFLYLLDKGSVYFSSHALRRLGTRFSVYASGETLALRGEPEKGGLEARGSRVHSKALKEEVERRYPGARKLYLMECGDWMVLRPTPETGEAGETFERLELKRKGTH